MSRIEPLRPERAGVLKRLALRYATRAFGSLPEPLGVTAHHSGVFWTWVIAETGVERTWRTLPRGIAGLATLRAAAVIGCPWCLDFGSALAKAGGVTEAQLRDLHRWPDSDVFDEAESLTLAYADTMTRTPMTVSDELIEQLRAHFSDSQLVELTALIALENQRSRFNHALGMTSQGFSSGTCALAARISAAVTPA